MTVIAEIVLLLACLIRLLVPFTFGLSSKNIYIMVISSISHNFVFVYLIILILLLLLKATEKKTKKPLTDNKTDMLFIISVIIVLVLSLL